MGKRANVQVYEDDEGCFRWRVVAANGEIVAVGEAYTTKADARRGWEDAAKAFRDAYWHAAESDREDPDESTD